MAPRRQLPSNPKAYRAMELITKGKKQSDVADRLNVSQSTVSTWKRQIEGTAARPKATTQARAVVPKASTSSRSSCVVKVATKSRTTIIKSGRIIIQEHTRSSSASGSVTKKRTTPVKSAKLSIAQRSNSRTFERGKVASTVPYAQQGTSSHSYKATGFDVHGNSSSAFGLQEDTSFSYARAGQTYW